MIEIKLDDQAIRTALDALAKQTTNLKPAMQDIGEYLTLATKKRFDKSEAPDGTPWAANKDSTLVNYLKKRGGLTGKKATRALAKKSPLKGESGDLARQLHYNASNNTLEFGSTMIYSAIQQFGAKKGQFGKAPWGDIPARPFLGLSDTDKTNIVTILQNHIKKGLE